MKGFKVANLDNLLEVIGKEKAMQRLADYSCPLNPDIEDFLKTKAIPFSVQGIAKTHLVFASFKGKTVLVGYFAIAYKTFYIRASSKLSAKMRSRIRKFARYIPETDNYEIVAPLIAQLGKNFTNGYDRAISGDELLKIACDHIQRIQSLAGGKIAYLECEDKPKLMAFYERNGFIEFDKRPLDKPDRDTFKSDYLVQMLRYF